MVADDPSTWVTHEESGMKVKGGDMPPAHPRGPGPDPRVVATLRERAGPRGRGARQATGEDGDWGPVQRTLLEVGVTREPRRDDRMHSDRAAQIQTDDDDPEVARLQRGQQVRQRLKETSKLGDMANVTLSGETWGDMVTDADGSPPRMSPSRQLQAIQEDEDDFPTNPKLPGSTSRRTGMLHKYRTRLQNTTTKAADLEKLRTTCLLDFLRHWNHRGQTYSERGSKGGVPYVVNIWPRFACDPEDEETYEKWCYARMILLGVLDIKRRLKRQEAFEDD
ncbi:hypothetical protein R3P38DRAFT_3206821 [Favolaschia claudopus]|uniref:Uncharacterized protein n=1 Tax=Favolaschia claudopus TaxID=2862362 RepID=A0AAV9ZXV3_9AGAR